MRYILILILIISFSMTCHAQGRKFEFYHFDGISLMTGDTVHIKNGSMGGQYVHIYTIWGGSPPIKLPFEGKHMKMIIDHFRRKKVEGQGIVYAVGYLLNLKNVSVYIEIDGAFKSGEVVVRGRLSN